MTGKRLAAALATLLCASLWPALPASAAEFGLSEFDFFAADRDGHAVTGAGAHPHELRTSFDFELDEEENPAAPVKDIVVELPVGLVGNPNAVPVCSNADFVVKTCQDASQVGVADLRVKFPGETIANVEVFNLTPPPGTVARLGFDVVGVPTRVDFRIDPDPPHRVIATTLNTSQAVRVYGADFTIWGVPAEHGGDPEGPSAPFVILPRACAGPLAVDWRVSSWTDPLDPIEGTLLTHEEAGNPQGFTACGALGFGPTIEAQPTTKAAQSATGLDFALETNNEESLLNAAADAVADADVREVEVALPEGLSINPAQAEGLEVCSEADLGRESAAAPPGRGCPEASKVGTIEVRTPLLKETLGGSLYVAEPYANLAGDSLIAVYVVIKHPGRGILVKQPIRVEPDPDTGRLLATAKDVPQLPFSEFRLHFREGSRAPLISPPGCGEFETAAQISPSSGAPPTAAASAFEIISGADGERCPRGAAPFEPTFEAGTASNQAGSYDPFTMRIERQDAEQDITRFSAVLPPGVLGRIAGVPWCPEAGIARARSRTGKEGGTRELADPSCPPQSQIGRTLAGAGVGPELTRVGGALYLAGPYKGAPLSVVSITPAVAGPFDAGVVVVRVALRLNPRSALVEADGLASDPIPHLLAGIPINIRELGVHVERPSFTLNATSCDPSGTLATIWGGGTALDPSRERAVGLFSRYQAAGCAALGMEPRLALGLRGKATKRGGHPALKAVLTPRAGDANFSRAAVTLPRSAFLDQGHIRTVCTRVQFSAPPGHGAACPPASRYGYARAWSPLLEQPLEGPVFLRSSDNKLPDLVIALKGIVEIELAARIDSVKGGIRASFEDIPDAPVSRFVLQMQGGQKGLIVNSRDLCARKSRARSRIRGQNGKLALSGPRVRPLGCPKRG